MALSDSEGKSGRRVGFWRGCCCCCGRGPPRGVVLEFNAAVVVDTAATIVNIHKSIPISFLSPKNLQKLGVGEPSSKSSERVFKEDSETERKNKELKSSVLFRVSKSERVALS